MSARAAFTVSGPGEDDHGVPSLGEGLSCAQTFAGRHRFDPGQVSFYVRDELGAGRAIVTKTEGGVIETRLVADRDAYGADFDEGAECELAAEELGEGVL